MQAELVTIKGDVALSNVQIYPVNLSAEYGHPWQFAMVRILIHIFDI